MMFSFYPATWILLVVTMTIATFALKTFWDRFVPLSGLPGPPLHFLFWRLLKREKSLPLSVCLVQLLSILTRQFEKNGVFRIWLGVFPVVVVFRPDIVEAILSSSVSLDKSWEYGLLHPWLGTGLLTSTGKKWRSRRKSLIPSFHFKILENFVPIINVESMVLIQKLKSLTDEDWVDICPLITFCTLDMVGGSIMGVHLGAQHNREHQYVKAIHSVGDSFNKRTVKPWLWPNWIFLVSPSGKTFRENLTILHNFTRKVIREKRLSILSTSEGTNCNKIPDDEDGCSNIKKKKVFMDLLLDLHIHEQLLTEEDIKEEVDTFMFGGHDTTAMGISWALYCIGLYSHVQKEIVKEMEDIFGDDKDRHVTFHDLRRMKYLECTLKESLRIFPSVPLIGRRLAETVNVDGVILPKDTTVHISIISLHQNSKEFPNPEVFDPDRFLPENSLKRHPYSYIPFSAGSRNCIGQKFAMMEEKIIISNIVRHFQVISLDPRDQILTKAEIVLRPAQPLRLKFIPRTL